MLADFAARLPQRQGRQWTYFATLTFRNPKTTAAGAGSALRSWLSSRRGPQYHCVLWAAEAQKRGTAHIHALWDSTDLSFTGDCERCKGKSYMLQQGHLCCGPEWRCLNEAWFHRHGIARFRPFDVARGFGVAKYLAKYVFKVQSEISDCTEWGIIEEGDL